jgi:hypothetical protein
MKKPQVRLEHIEVIVDPLHEELLPPREISLELHPSERAEEAGEGVERPAGQIAMRI